jgi:Skp family chaperone for outer membrane proteins
MKLFSLPIFIIIFSLAFFAQSVKTAKVNFDAFEDEKIGIKELTDVLGKLDIEFNPKFDELKLAADKITKFEKEIRAKYKDYGTSCPIGPSKIQEEADAYEKLVADYKEKQEYASFLFEKRRKEVTEPISKRIRVKLAEFNKIKGFAFIHDSSNSNSFVIDGVTIDVTQEFIKFCNEEFEKEKNNFGKNRNAVVPTAKLLIKCR